MIPGSERSPGEGNGYPLQYSCLKNSSDGGAWWATIHGVTKSQTRLSDLHTFSLINSEQGKKEPEPMCESNLMEEGKETVKGNQSHD